MGEIIWRGMTRAQLDAAYNNTAAVLNSAGKAKGHVRFTPNSGHVQCTSPCLLCAISGHHAGLSATATYASWGDFSWPSRSISGARND